MQKSAFLSMVAPMLIVIGCSSSFTENASPAATSTTVQVQRARIDQTVKARAIAKPSPNGLVRVGFPMPKDVSRRISRLTVVEGNMVRTGDVLAELDHSDLTATLHQLREEATVAERSLAALRALEPSDIQLAEAALAEAQAQADLAQINMDRIDALTQERIASKRDFDVASNALAVAKAKHRHAQVTLQNIKTRYQTEVATAEAKLSAARAGLNNIEVQIGWNVLRSPMNGQVFAVHQRLGELSSNQPQAPVVTLLDPIGMQLHLYVDESDFGRIKQGQDVTFRLDAYPEQTLKGQIVRILPQPILQENVVYYLAVADVEEVQRPLLRPEMTALAHVEIGSRDGVLRLPLSAVKSRRDGWYVVRVGSDGRAAETAVQIGWKDDAGVEIREGLSSGDTVLLAP